MTTHQVVPLDQWIVERKGLLTKEKELTRMKDAVAEARRALPWTPVSTDYSLKGDAGKIPFSALFGTRSQLLVYHFMYGPDWEAGCKSCSFWADHFDAMVPHLAARDVAFAAIARAPYEKLRNFARRMGWRFPFYSSEGTSLNGDFGVYFTPDEVEAQSPLYNFGTAPVGGEERHGISAFVRSKGDGKIYRTYSTYARGAEPINATYAALDWMANGRDEGGLPFTMSWVRLHDEYAG